MYLAIDIGGTKTLIACFNNQGVITEEFKFPTSPDYSDFTEELEHVISNLKAKDFDAGAVAVPGVLDRKSRVALSFPNIPWRNVDLGNDVGHIIKAPVVVENDAKLAGFSEAIVVAKNYSRVLYVTLSTGIGYAFIIDGLIDPTPDSGLGGNTIVMEQGGKYVSWESQASGHAIVEKYSKLAKDINDDETWAKIAVNIGAGLIQLIGVFCPEVVVIGGSVGNYFSRYAAPLNREIKKYSLPLLVPPTLKAANRPDEAVVFGCYELAKKAAVNG